MLLQFGRLLTPRGLAVGSAFPASCATVVFDDVRTQSGEETKAEGAAGSASGVVLGNLEESVSALAEALGWSDALRAAHRSHPGNAAKADAAAGGTSVSRSIGVGVGVGVGTGVGIGVGVGPGVDVGVGTGGGGATSEAGTMTDISDVGSSSAPRHVREYLNRDSDFAAALQEDEDGVLDAVDIMADALDVLGWTEEEAATKVPDIAE